MSRFMEQRIVLCSGLALANGLIVGLNGTTTPLNLQDLSGTGVPQGTSYDVLGVELIWTGAAGNMPVGTIVVMGSLTGAAGMTILGTPSGGSQNPDFSPADSDLLEATDPDGNVQIVPPFLPALNLVKMSGTSGSALLGWRLRDNPVNYLQLSETLSSGAGTLTCTLSLRYQT